VPQMQIDLGKSESINALSNDQMRLILASREMITKVIQGKVFIAE